MSEWPPAVAGNGLLDRRLFLRGGLAAAGALVMQQASASPEDVRQPWMRAPGAPLNAYGQPSRYEAHVQRLGMGSQPGTVGSGASRSPLQHLQGTLTPTGLHFERHHSGIPDIDPDQHQLTIHGLVKRNLRFSLDALHRYPMVSRTMFLECSGNSAINLGAQAAQRSCGEIHGLVSGSEWTGVPLAHLLAEAGVDPAATWVVAEGADAVRMHRSIPLDKMLGDAMVALYQNGERLRPEQGYPMRLFLPGYEGNTSIKWLHRLQVSRQPAMSRQETSKYTDLRADGRSQMFTFTMGVKSVITSPSPGLALQQPGLYELTGLAWTGSGKVRQVDVSADGGRSWAPAQLQTPVLSQALTRFRIPWRWDGGPAVLLSRASDADRQQPTRTQLINQQGQASFYHYNAIQAWRVDAAGQIYNVYV